MQSLLRNPGKYSIRTHLVVFTIAIIFLLVSVLTAFTIWNSTNILKDNASRELSQALLQSSGNLERFIELRQSNLDVWASQPIIDVFFSNHELAVLTSPGVRTFFSRIRSTKPWLKSVLLTDHGHILYDGSNTLGGRGDGFVADTVRPLLEQPTPAYFVLRLPQLSGSSQAVLFIKHPFLKHNRPVPGEFLVAAIDLDTLQHTLLGKVKIGQTGFVSLLAQTQDSGIWTAAPSRTDPEARQFRVASHHWRHWSDIPAASGSLLLKVSRLAPCPLGIAGIVSVHDIRSPVYLLVRTLVGAGLAVLILGIGVTVAFSKIITRPLDHLLTCVRQIELDNMELFEDFKKPPLYTEVHILQQAFATMVRRLTLSRKELQLRNSELQELEHSLRMQRNYLHTPLSSIGEGVVTTDEKAHITFMNLVAEQALGCSTEQTMHRPLGTVFRIINEETRREIENPVAKVLQTGKIVGLANHTILINKNGTEIPIDNSGAPIRDDKGTLYGVVLVFRDITARRNAEKQILENEERFRSLFESNPTSIALADFSGVKTRLDALQASGIADIGHYLKTHPETAAEYTKQTTLVDVNRATLTLFGAETKEHLIAELNNGFASGSHAYFREEEIAALWKDGNFTKNDLTIKTLSSDERSVTLHGTVVPGSEASLSRVLISINDLTEHKRLEEQLFQAQKMESIGDLAGGVAHDYNNMLGVIHRVYGDGPGEWCNPKTHCTESQEIHGAAKRSAEITGQLLAFARKQTITPEVLDLNRTVEGMLKMLQRLIGEDIDLAWLPAESAVRS